jgi:trans-aconitate methyltransferase
MREPVEAGRMTLLELGCGGGSLAAHLAPEYALTLTDSAPDMLRVCRSLHPTAEIIEGDMRSLRLGRTFDRVLIHDAIGYMTTIADLRAALATAALHCRPGGIALFIPDAIEETFDATTDCGGHDDPSSLRGARYLEWTWRPAPDSQQTITDYTFTLRNQEGQIQIVQDRHVEGLFGRQEWLACIQAAGFSVWVAPPWEEDGELIASETFVATRI